MGGARLYKVGSPFNASELAELDYEQSADTMYLAHLDHAPGKLLRYAHTDWRFVDVTFGPTASAPATATLDPHTPNTDADNSGAAYFPQEASYAITAINDDTGQETRAKVTNNVENDLTLKRNYNTITWSAAVGASRYRVFKSDNNRDYGYIGSTTDLTFRDDNITADLSDGPPVGDNPFTGAGEYPSTVAFFQQRLMWGRSKNRPNAVWGSRSGDFENMDISRPLKADDALSFALVGGRVNSINQLVGASDLLALTSDSLFSVSGGGGQDGDAIGPTNIVSKRQIGRGSSRLNPLVVDNVVFYRPSTGTAVRTIGYQFEQDGYVSNDVSIYSPHLFEGFDIVSWAYAQEPRSVIWAIRSDGKLLCFTWEQEQQVWGWTLCDTDGTFESVCVVSEDGEDRAYFVVRRRVNGVKVRLIERMDAAVWDDVREGIWLDCATSFRFDAPTATIEGLFHLVGRTVTALVDGSSAPDLAVGLDGTVTLPYPGNIVTVGIPYTSLIETLPLALNGANGTAAGKRGTIGKVMVRLVNSRGAQIGPSEDRLFPLKSREDENYGAPAALKTGLFAADMPALTTTQPTVVIKSDEPLPLTITAVFIEPHQSEA